MEEKLKETTIILISIIKWSILATIVGIAVGLSATLFLKALNLSTFLTNQYPYYFLFLPLALFFKCLRY